MDNPIQTIHAFRVTTESDSPLTEGTVLALLNAGLRLEGTQVRVTSADPIKQGFPPGAVGMVN